MKKLFRIRAYVNFADFLLGAAVLLGLGILGIAALSADSPGQSGLLEGVFIVGLAFSVIIVMTLRLYRQERRLRLGEESTQGPDLRGLSGCAVMVVSEEGCILSVNQRFSEVSGFSPEELAGWHLKMLSPAKVESALTSEQHWSSSMLQDGWQGEMLTRRQDGQNHWLAATVSRFHASCGSEQYMISCLDINSLKQANQQMRQLALYDSLTGLANRRLFVDRLDQGIAGARRDNRRVALMFLDLDKFKGINDKLGHDAGDQLLVEIGARLEACVRNKDTVARLGGDEFTVLLTDVEDSLASTLVADKILKALSKPIMLGQHEVIVSASIGVTLAPDDGLDAETLMKNADLALYRAKERGRDCCHYFTEELNARVMRHMIVEQELRHALESDEFILEFQPQVDLKTECITSVEALLRWQHPTRGCVYPRDFVSVAEESGLILEIDRWVLRNACLQMKVMRAITGQAIRVAVNLSARQFADENLVDLIQEVLQESNLDPRYLELEVTETMLMGDKERVIERLRELKQTGVLLSIDDFGSGYSSLSYLRQLPIDFLKVDRQFVKDIPDNLNDMEITSAVIAVAHKLGLKVVAEGVENDDQRDFLVINKCDYAQGYYFSKPLTLEALYPYLKTPEFQTA